MMNTTMIATAIALGTLATSAQAQFSSCAPFVSGAASATPSSTTCGVGDDGTTENALGLSAGGEIGWINVVTCNLPTVNTVKTAYGTSTFPVTNGNSSKIVVYTSSIGATDPNDPSWVVQTTINTVVMNGGTDILNAHTFPSQTIPPGSTLMVLASADHIAGERPGPMGQNVANPDAWVVGSTLGPGTLNITTLTANNVPPLNMNAIGFPCTWLLRIEYPDVAMP